MVGTLAFKPRVDEFESRFDAFQQGLWRMAVSSSTLTDCRLPHDTGSATASSYPRFMAVATEAAGTLATLLALCGGRS